MPRRMMFPLFVVAALLALGGFRMLHTLSKAELPFGEPVALGVGQGSVPPDARPVSFDGKRAMGYLESICKIGPRISGTEGMKKQEELVKKHFEALGATVEFQRFRAQQESQPRPVDMANMIISWHPERERRVLLCSHYDTRPIADQEPDVRKWREPFISANDGGSGVAFLMELGNHMKNLKTEIGVDFVLFDGEEYIFDPGPGHDKYFFGSEYFGGHYKTDPPKFRYLAGVLLDMIGGKEAKFPIEQNSWFEARRLVDDLWRIAAAEKCDSFKNAMGSAVLDDHLALNKAGIPTVDLIDFEYPHWHRLTDVPANCSAESLEKVSRVLTVWLQRVR
jgi:glutaminyl-peptide cyclotransferase